jgi:hypothetical protein
MGKGILIELAPAPPPHSDQSNTITSETVIWYKVRPALFFHDSVQRDRTYIRPSTRTKMDLYAAFAIGFLGSFGALLLLRVVTRISRTTYSRISRWWTRHVVTSRTFKSQHTFNPTRAQLICLFVHLAVTSFYNSFRVHTISQASTRAGQLCLLHAVPLLFPMQVAYTSYALDISLGNAKYAHVALGIMAIVQGCLHCILQYVQGSQLEEMSVSQILVRETEFSYLPLH